MASKVNAVGNERRFWGTMPVLPGAALTATVQQMEKAGFEGVFVLQIYGPPFVPLAAASTVTETLKLGTGIAIAGTRSPRSEEHTSELQSLMRISYAVFCLNKKKHLHHKHNDK